MRNVGSNFSPLHSLVASLLKSSSIIAVNFHYLGSLLPVASSSGGLSFFYRSSFLAIFSSSALSSSSTGLYSSSFSKKS